MTRRKVTPEEAIELLWAEVKRLRMLSLHTDDREKAGEHNRLADALCLALAALERNREQATERMTITLKGVPPSINRFAGRQNAWEYRAEKEWWTGAAELACRACKDRPKEPWPLALVEVTYFFPDRRRRDADNYAGKFLLDGLTRAGVIVDDDFNHISLGLNGDYDKKRPRTEIVVTKRRYRE